MTTREKLERQLTVAWHRLGIDGDTLAVDSDGTIGAPLVLVDGKPLGRLPALLGEGGSSTLPPFELGATIGEGGMGVVRVARQRALEREVAIKSLRGEVEDAAAVAELVREARVAGVLEHPNVVPIHALGRDERGRPMIVMKRIEGTSWREVLDTDRHEDALGEALDRHLDILVQVARAAHFAHAKGIVHRDLKPQNVMIGAFGEVYLVDWGIAVALREGVVSGLPLAAKVRHVAGTPEYLAPEMAAGDGARIDARSDVFLLGAILHELLTGRPPHRGSSIKEMLARAYRAAPPRYPESAPPELAAICQRAMQAEPADRYPQAEAFADAVAAYRKHRSAALVSDEAAKRLGLLERAITAGDRRAVAYEAFNECRFGFTQARRMWPDNQRATDGLQRAVQTMIGYELEHGAARAAAALLTELPRPDGALADRVAAAMRVESQAGERIAALERERDVTIGDRKRATLLAVQAAAWLIINVACGALSRHGVFVVGHYTYAGLNAVAALISVAGVYATRAELSATEAARRLTIMGTLFYGGYALLFALGGLTGIGLWQCFVIMSLLALLLWGATALLADRRAGRMALLMLLTLGGVLALPRYPFEVTGVGGAVAMLWLAHVWARQPAADEADEAG